MTEEEVEIEESKFFRRKAAFVKEGLPEVDAEELAFRMMMRDRDQFDDRRVCFECKNYIMSKCFKYKDRFGRPDTPPRFTLMRCDSFDLRGAR